MVDEPAWQSLVTKRSLWMQHRSGGRVCCRKFAKGFLAEYGRLVIWSDTLAEAFNWIETLSDVPAARSPRSRIYNGATISWACPEED